jgi:hypothetical protein
MKDIAKLLMYVNAVTAPHRHHQKIPKHHLDKLANFQIDCEHKFGMFGDKAKDTLQSVENLSKALEEALYWLELFYDEYEIEGSMPLRSLIDKIKILLKGELC